MDIHGDIVDWLLEEGNPPVRYLTLRYLLKRPARNLELSRAKSRLMDYSVTQAILRHAPEVWADDEDRAVAQRKRRVARPRRREIRGGGMERVGSGEEALHRVRGRARLAAGEKPGFPAPPS